MSKTGGFRAFQSMAMSVANLTGSMGVDPVVTVLLSLAFYLICRSTSLFAC